VCLLITLKFIHLLHYSYTLLNMKKIIGLLITAIGILIIGGYFAFTPNHAFNPADSTSGIDAHAGIVYGGFITFGIGMVIFISTLPYAGEKAKQS
jgi:energy-coupling factor transporter transmembrane protein EcfT